ncbi:MAG: hypothetical protein WC632_05975 [Candidatus Margulisiibacteriota bacterium]
MYQYSKPKPIPIKLIDSAGFDLRQKAFQFVSANPNTTGAERGSEEQQGFGALAEIVVRKYLGMPEINPSNRPSLGYDFLLPTGIKVDVKCRGGTLPFKEEYLSNDDIPREAKHNFWPRQMNDDRLDVDIYLMTHLKTPSKKTRKLPGTKRQKWILYICGWVSKERVKREGVYLPRGSLTEQGKTWFTYQKHDIEFYNKNLNGLQSLDELLKIDQSDVNADIARKGDLNLTSVDAIRITYDLIGRGILNNKHLEYIKKKANITNEIKPILSSNQYFHLLEWFKEEGLITDKELERAAQILKKEPYTGI